MMENWIVCNFSYFSNDAERFSRTSHVHIRLIRYWSIYWFLETILQQIKWWGKELLPLQRIYFPRKQWNKVSNENTGQGSTADDSNIWPLGNAYEEEINLSREEKTIEKNFDRYQLCFSKETRKRFNKILRAAENSRPIWRKILQWKTNSSSPPQLCIASLIVWVVFLILHPDKQSLWLGAGLCLASGGLMVFSAFSCVIMRGPRIGNFIRTGCWL